ncbi:MAG: hypothetical protein JNK64_33015 [Myxococcales bacterium]|nr:hypothetical protein [Myxococcales bacterium]
MPPTAHRLTSVALVALASGCSTFLTRPATDHPTRRCPSARWLPGLDLAAGAATGVGTAVSLRAAGAASRNPDDAAESGVIAYTLVGLVAAAATVGFIASGVHGYVVSPRCRGG